MIEILQGLLTPVIALITTGIAYQQYITNKNKLRLDLFEKRYEVYQFIRTFVAHILMYGDVDDKEIDKFINNTKKNIFLFNEDVSNYIDEVEKKAIELQKLEKQLDRSGSEKIANEREKVFKWFGDQFEQSKNIFSNYLRITD